jgi:lysophospholipase L1-like esterase
MLVAKPPQPEPLSRQAQWILRLLMIVVGPVLMLATLEGVAYLWERQQANGQFGWELVASRRIELVAYPSPGAGYTLMKPRRQYTWQGIPVSINSKGLRGAEIDYSKPEGVVRILNLGDSVAMGWGVRVEDTYGQRLEALLNEGVEPGRRYEVVNAGVPGWNLENSLAYLQAEGERYQPDVVLLDITLVNDIFGSSALEEAGRRHPIIQWLRSHTHFWPFLTVQYRWLEAKAAGRERIDVIDPPHNPEQYFPLAPDAAQWKEVRASLSAIQQVAQANSTPLILVLFPLEYQVVDPGYSTLPQETIREFARAANLPAVDLLSAYQTACQQKPGGPCQVEDRYLFADVWMHPSAYGHGLAASEIAAALPVVP